MAGWFELSKSSDNQFRFMSKAGNSKTILASGLYTSKISAEKGIASVHSNSPQKECYEKKATSNSKFYFNLKAADHQIIGSNQTYATTQPRETGIVSVRANDTNQTVKDNMQLQHQARVIGVWRFTGASHNATISAPEVGTLSQLLHQVKRTRPVIRTKELYLNRSSPPRRER